MNKQKLFLYTVLLASIFVSIVILFNFQSYIQGLNTQDYHTPLIMTVATFVNMLATVLSIVNIRTNKYSKLWYFVVIVFSSFGNVVFSAIKLVGIYRKERLLNA